MNRESKRTKGFTLIEILVVISIIAITAGVILVAINPAKRMAQANDVQRLSDIQLILSAVYNYRVDHNWQLPDCENSGRSILKNGLYGWIGPISGANELDCYTDNRCKAAWTMEEASLIEDHSLNSNTAVPQSDASQTDGLHGKAFEFEPFLYPYTGETDHLKVDDDDSLDITEEITIAAWIDPDSKSVVGGSQEDNWQEGLRGILSKGNSYKISLGPYNEAASKFVFAFKDDVGHQTIVYTDDEIGIDDGWHHVAATYKKSGTATIKLYIDPY